MPDATSALIGGGASLLGGSMQAEAASRAAEMQLEATKAGIAEQRRQFEAIQQQLQPFTMEGQMGAQAVGTGPFGRRILGVGESAFEQIAALSGAAGPQAAEAAIQQIEQSPEFQARMRQGEEALLQRASATGGLRGGNVQAALAQFRPQLLAEQIDRQYGRLSGLASTGIGTQMSLAELGQASAAQQAAAGGRSASAIAGLLQDAGAARASGAMSGGTATAGQFLSSIPSMMGSYYGMTGRPLIPTFGLPGSGATFEQPMMATGGTLV